MAASSLPLVRALEHTPGGSCIKPFLSLRLFSAWLAFALSLTLTLWVVFDFVTQVGRISAARDAVEPSPTPAPAKVAYFVPPPTLAPTSTFVPTATMRPANTATPFATSTPTARATATPPAAHATRQARAALPVVTPSPLLVPTSTRTSTPSPTATAVSITLGETYGTIPVEAASAGGAAARQADVNLSLRGFAPAKSFLGLVDYTGDTDSGAPQLASLFADNRVPTFSGTFQVYDWNWGCGCKGGLISDPEVTLAGLQVTNGEALRLPASGREIGGGYQAMVLYADLDQIVFKYTRRDGVTDGYMLHVHAVLVDSSLLALYERTDRDGRGELPALRAGQPFGRARGSEVRIAIRDTGTFMDPRSRKDWWRGK